MLRLVVQQPVGAALPILRGAALLSWAQLSFCPLKREDPVTHRVSGEPAFPGGMRFIVARHRLRPKTQRPSSARRHPDTYYHVYPKTVRRGVAWMECTGALSCTPDCTAGEIQELARQRKEPETTPRLSISISIAVSHPQIPLCFIWATSLLRSLFLWLLLLIPLPFQQGHARAAGFAYQNRCGQHLGRGIGEIRARADDFPGREFDLARSATHLGDAAVSFDEVASVHWGEEFYLVVGAEKTLVAIEADAQFGAYVAKELQHLRTIDQVATIVGVVRTHPYPDHSGR